VDIQKSFREHQEFIDLIRDGEMAEVLEAHAEHIQSVTDKLKEPLTS
jgi:DNA-binding GntR family transcriptional regulator